MISVMDMTSFRLVDDEAMQSVVGMDAPTQNALCAKYRIIAGACSSRQMSVAVNSGGRSTSDDGWFKTAVDGYANKVVVFGSIWSSVVPVNSFVKKQFFLAMDFLAKFGGLPLDIGTVGHAFAGIYRMFNGIFDDEEDAPAETGWCAADSLSEMLYVDNPSLYGYNPLHDDAAAASQASINAFVSAVAGNKRARFRMNRVLPFVSMTMPDPTHFYAVQHTIFLKFASVLGRSDAGLKSALEASWDILNSVEQAMRSSASIKYEFDLAKAVRLCEGIVAQVGRLVVPLRGPGQIARLLSLGITLWKVLFAEGSSSSPTCENVRASYSGLGKLRSLPRKFTRYGVITVQNP